MTGTNTKSGSGGTTTSGGPAAAPALALEPLASAMKRLGVGKTTVYKLAQSGKLRMCMLPGVKKTGVVTADVDALIMQALEASA